MSPSHRCVGYRARCVHEGVQTLHSFMHTCSIAFFALWQRWQASSPRTRRYLIGCRSARAVSKRPESPRRPPYDEPFFLLPSSRSPALSSHPPTYLLLVHCSERVGFFLSCPSPLAHFSSKHKSKSLSAMRRFLITGILRSHNTAKEKIHFELLHCLCEFVGSFLSFCEAEKLESSSAEATSITF